MNDIAQWTAILLVGSTSIVTLLLCQRWRRDIGNAGMFPTLGGPPLEAPWVYQEDVQGQKVDPEDLGFASLDVSLTGYVIWLTSECPTCALILAEIPDGFSHADWVVVLQPARGPSSSRIDGTVWMPENGEWQSNAVATFDEDELGEPVRLRGYFPMLIVVQDATVMSVLGGADIVEFLRGTSSVQR